MKLILQEWQLYKKNHQIFFHRSHSVLGGFIKILLNYTVQKEKYSQKEYLPPLQEKKQKYFWKQVMD